MQPWCWAKDFKGSMKLFASHCGPQIYRRVWEKDQLYDKRTLAPRTEKLMWFPDEPGGGKWLAVRFTGNQTHKNIANGFAPPDNFHVWSHYNHKCPFLFFFLAKEIIKNVESIIIQLIKVLDAVFFLLQDLGRSVFKSCHSLFIKFKSGLWLDHLKTWACLILWGPSNCVGGWCWQILFI